MNGGKKSQRYKERKPCRTTASGLYKVKLYVAHEPSGAAHFYGWYKASNGARGSVWGEALPPLSREFVEIA